MNGIIHQCTHSDDDPDAVVPETVMFEKIGQYIARLFEVIQPQQVFFMAVDGVAPRAKMNQQRARRFKAAREAAERNEEKKRKGKEVQGLEAPFDSNCITPGARRAGLCVRAPAPSRLLMGPHRWRGSSRSRLPGTEFMTRLSLYLKYFVARMIGEDQKWRKVRVILSGHEVPGEGEHKIMSFIRSQKSLPEYNPNTRHCLYGLDADLIMLGLLSHEPHFALLREEVTFGRKNGKQAYVRSSGPRRRRRGRCGRATDGRFQKGGGGRPAPHAGPKASRRST